MSNGPPRDRDGQGPNLDAETREAFEESYRRYERMLKKLAEL